MAEPISRSRRKFKFFWVAEPGHPHEVGVLHKRPPAAGTHKPLRKKPKINCKVIVDYLDFDRNEAKPFTQLTLPTHSFGLLILFFPSFPVFFLPYGGVAGVRERLLSAARQALSRIPAGRGESETRLCAAPTRGNPRSEVSPPSAFS